MKNILRHGWVLAFALVISGCATVPYSGKLKPYVPPQANLGRVHVAVVLGSGGVRGLAHLGVLEVLSQAGITPDLVVGCSAGSIVGAMYAEGQSFNVMKRKLLGTKPDDLLQMSVATWPVSIYQQAKLTEYLEKTIHSRKFSQTKIPFAVVATNLEFGNETIFSSGRIIPAVQASSSVPGAYMPQIIAGQPFVDGAVSSPVPVAAARRLGATIVIAVDVGNTLASSRPNNFFAVMSRSLEISYANASKLTADQADIVIRVPFVNQPAFESKDNEYLYQMGRKAALAKVDAIKVMIRKRLLKQIVN